MSESKKSSDNPTVTNVKVQMNIRQGTGIAGNVEGDMIVNPQQSLTYAATEIQELLEILNQSYSADIPTDTQAKMEEAVKGINKNPALKERVIAALEAGGIEAVKKITDHPCVGILLAAYEGWKKSKHRI